MIIKIMMINRVDSLLSKVKSYKISKLFRPNQSYFIFSLNNRCNNCNNNHNDFDVIIIVLLLLSLPFYCFCCFNELSLYSAMIIITILTFFFLLLLQYLITLPLYHIIIIIVSSSNCLCNTLIFAFLCRRKPLHLVDYSVTSHGYTKFQEWEVATLLFFIAFVVI